jgi:hypothetical protein
MPLWYIYACFYVIPIGHYTWFVVTCNALSLERHGALEGRRKASYSSFRTQGLLEPPLSNLLHSVSCRQTQAVLPDVDYAPYVAFCSLNYVAFTLLCGLDYVVLL